MTTRRRFIAVFPVAGASLLVACGKQEAPAPAPAAAPAAPPAEAPAPAPAPAAAPAPAPAAEPAPAPAPAAAPGGMVDANDATAKSLGYVADAKTTKVPKYIAGSACANCALYGGQPGDAAGPCPLFAGKQVAATGWCTAYAKKA